MNNQVRTNSPAKRLLSKNMIVTLGVTLFVIAALILARGIFAMIYSQKLQHCSSLYQIFGVGSVPVVNLVTAIVTAVIIALLAAALFMSRIGAKGEPASVGGLVFLKAMLIVSIIYTALAVVVSFASVSVINYTDVEGYTGFINLSATGLFLFTFFLGISFLCCEIAFIRFCNSLIVNLQSGVIAKKGPGLIFVASAVGVLTALVDFCIKLFHLVAPPKDYIANINADKATSQLNNAELIINSFNVVIFAAVVLLFITMAMIAGSYAISADTILRNSRMSSYNMGHTMANPENMENYVNGQNYNYNQSPDFTPFYNQRASFNSVNQNVYSGDVPPIPPAPEMPFRPKTTYPQQSPSQNNSNSQQ